MWIRMAPTLMFFGLVGVVAVGVAQPVAGGNGGAQLTPVVAADVRTPGAVTPLGDLSTYRAIAVDTLRIVNTGDLAAAKKRIKDLEMSWDRAEPKMKPLAPEKWTTVDVAIDRALKEVRAWRATQADAGEALKALISKIDEIK